MRNLDWDKIEAIKAQFLIHIWVGCMSILKIFESLNLSKLAFSEIFDGAWTSKILSVGIHDESYTTFKYIYAFCVSDESLTTANYISE